MCAIRPAIYQDGTATRTFDQDGVALTNIQHMNAQPPHWAAMGESPKGGCNRCSADGSSQLRDPTADCGWAGVPYFG